MRLWLYACAIAIAGLVLGAAFAPLLAPSDPLAIDPANRLLSPFEQSSHWLGTDTLGRDILARLLYGGRTSLFIGIASTVIALGIGIATGLVAAMARGWMDEMLSWVINIQLSIPAVVLAISISAVLGNGLWNVVAAIAVTLWPQFARIARGATLSVLQMAYVEAARALGGGPVFLALRHILPNIATPVAALATLEFGHAIVSEAALAFLGFGVEPSRPSWGAMIAEGRPYLSTFIWLTLLPSIVLSLATMAVSYLSDAIGEAHAR